MMVWRLLSFWDDLFSGAMLNFQRVIDINFYTRLSLLDINPKVRVILFYK